MLSREDNELLVRVGPGTAMGNLFRRFWTPVMLAAELGGEFTLPEESRRLYVECMRQPGHAEAGSRWYRSFQTTEIRSWMAGEYNDHHVDVPVRWLTGTDDPVATSQLLTGYSDHISDFEIELVDGVGHWIVAQRPDLVLDRVRKFLTA